MKNNAKIIKTLPDNEIVVTDIKKSIAYFDFKEKLSYFFLYVKYHNFNVESGLERNEIEDYISFLAKTNTNLNKVKEKIEAEIKEKEAATNLEYEKRDIREKGEAKLDKVQAKLDKVHQKTVEAVSELNVIDEAKIINGEPIEEEKEQSVEEPVSAPIEEAIEPAMEVEPEMVNQESVVPIEEQPIVGSDLLPIEEEKEQEIQKPVTPIEEVPVEELVKKTTEEVQEQSVKEPMAISIVSVRDKTADDKTEEEKKQQAEEAKLSPLEQNFNNFEKAIKEIEQNFTDDFSKKISGMFVLVNNEVKELVTKQLSEMSNTAKEAINNANQNTLNAKNELAVMEQDRNEYKSHYEQATEVVKQKEDTLKSRDGEINSLKAQLENKNNELKASADKETALTKVIETKNKMLLQLKGDLVRSQQASIELSKLLNDKIEEKSISGFDLSEQIDPGEIDGPEIGKRKL